MERVIASADGLPCLDYEVDLSRPEYELPPLYSLGIILLLQELVRLFQNSLAARRLVTPILLNAATKIGQSKDFSGKITSLTIFSELRWAIFLPLLPGFNIP